MNETVLVSGRDAVYQYLPGEGPPLVMIHGAGSNHHGFDDLAMHLGGREMIIPSFPGRCGSEGEPLHSVADMAAWLRKLLRTIGVDRAVVLGHSLGGAVAIDYALAQRHADGPDLAGLVLVSTGARLRVAPAILDAVREAVVANLPCELPPEAWQRDPDPLIVTRVEQARARTTASVALVDWMAADAFDRMQDLGDIDCETLVIAGSGDRLTPEKYAQYLAGQIRAAKLHVLYGASHMCVAERPPDLARPLSTWGRGAG